MIGIDMLVREQIGVIGYYQQSLRLHPEQADKWNRYLTSERDRLARLLQQYPSTLDITQRAIVW